MASSSGEIPMAFALSTSLAEGYSSKSTVIGPSAMPQSWLYRVGRSNSSPLEGRSSLLHKGVDHLLLSRLVEGDHQLVALDRADVAVAELLVEDAVAPRPAAAGGRIGGGHQAAVALDQRMPRRAVRRRAGGGEGLGPLPAGRGIAAAEARSLVPAALGFLHAGRGSVVAGVRLGLDVVDRQFVDE